MTALAGLLTVIAGIRRAAGRSPNTPTPRHSESGLSSQLWDCQDDLLRIQDEIADAQSEAREYRLMALAALRHVWTLERRIAVTGGHPPERPEILRI
jgi:hypothetical protein